MGVQAGRLRDRITIERATVTTDDYGGEASTWAELVTLSAQVSNGTGQERREAAQESATVAATFRVRHSGITEGITTTDRIRFDGAAWDIVSNVRVPNERQARDITATRQAA